MFEYKPTAAERRLFAAMIISSVVFGFTAPMTDDWMINSGVGIYHGTIAFVITWSLMTTIYYAIKAFTRVTQRRGDRGDFSALRTSCGPIAAGIVTPQPKPRIVYLKRK